MLHEHPTIQQRLEARPTETKTQRRNMALWQRPPKLEQTILYLLVQGYTLRKAVRCLRLSKSQVARHRQVIESAARELGLSPPITLLGGNGDDGFLTTVTFPVCPSRCICPRDAPSRCAL